MNGPMALRGQTLYTPEQQLQSDMIARLCSLIGQGATLREEPNSDLTLLSAEGHHLFRFFPKSSVLLDVQHGLRSRLEPGFLRFLQFTIATYDARTPI